MTIQEEIKVVNGALESALNFIGEGADSDDRALAKYIREGVVALTTIENRIKELQDLIFDQKRRKPRMKQNVTHQTMGSVVLEKLGGT